MSIERLHKLLNTDKDCVRINRDLLKALNIEEALLYSILVSEYQKKLKLEDYKFFDDKKFIYCPVEDIEQFINLSAFKQRNILNNLQKKDLLFVKLGHARARYIWINDDASVLEELLYGYTVDKYQEDLMKIFIKQLNNFRQQKNIKIESSYIADYGLPWEKILSNDLSSHSSYIGWITKNEYINKPIIDIDKVKTGA